MKALIVGGTGNVGKLVVEQLLQRNVHVQAIVRSPDRIPSQLVANPSLTLIKASLLELSIDELAEHLRGCDVVISTLGHNLSYNGIPALGVWAPPQDLVEQASRNICHAIEKLQPSSPIRYIMLNTVGVANPDGSDTHTRSTFERSMVSLMTTVLPPYRDSVMSAAYLGKEVGTSNKYIEWVAVRPDGFIDGEVSSYSLFESIRHPFYAPEKVTKANIAHFMGELVTKPETWNQWKFKMPVIIDEKQ
ncbi:uncharacterized protein BJ171DRAFT_197029 [Polychytrium aggregatum]|uniref:uncharacterized protein n=1 Tax=Polychytrium aggregatum TaxID=110093 RepID=UPI0022FDEDEA|nr:uncharacterized protein BJ171DRAFT_197029 [Polychytrium aggregatum]KAI9201877.1 hypothetical protein BJ171DRAFT_197029 [Polychytrium aggregatum]